MADQRGQPPERPASSFEERLRTAREKRGLEPASQHEGEGMGWAERPLAMAFRLAGEMLASLVVGVAIGWWLDRVLGTAPWLLLVFVVLGTAAGILNVWRLVSPKDEQAPKQEGPPRSEGSGKVPKE
ncbi:MAG: AtpZ/AtpI family protein [Acetobacteraceae bacterium]